MTVDAVKSDRAAGSKGPSCKCDAPARKAGRPWRLVLLGAPGVGKGTQAELLHGRTGACQLSTGDVFREAYAVPEAERSPAITAALEFMRRGELVPDDTVVAVVRERSDCLRCRGGFLLDGFPRTVAQAEALKAMLADMRMNLDAVVNFELPIEEIVSRLSGRRTCARCKSVFHVTARPPKVAGVCDNCGGPLVQREDDRPEAVRVRMETYQHSTLPLTNYFHQHGLLVVIDAHGTPEDIFQRTVERLGIAQNGKSLK